MLLDQRYIRYFDWINFTIVLVLSALSLLFVFSSTYRLEQPFSLFFSKQLFGILSGILIFILCCATDFRSLQRWSYFLYIATIFLLLFTIVKGSWAMGAGRWINLGIFKFQPSELTKLFFPGFFTYYLATEKKQEFTLTTFLPILAILLISTLLIRKQPDLGTALIILFSGSALLWLAGLSKKFFFYSFLVVVITAPLSWHFLKEYQKKRIEVFLGGGDSRKERYHLEQSKIAIGSGGFTGKGFLKGTQNKLQFLPESRTDFIFAVICEEWGFIGALIIIFLYWLLFIRILTNISLIKNFYAQLLAMGLIIHIIISTLINMGMVIGLLPIVGIPLPLVSYGISHLWITFASLGWLQGITIRAAFSK